MNSGSTRLVTETLAYDGGRDVTVRIPPADVDAVVFAADGGWHTARLVDALESADGSMPMSTMVVGVQGMDSDDGRFPEYVPGVDDDRFATHESFFVGEVPAWLESRFGVALDPARTGVWGASLGGEFALAMGVRHPDRFGVAFSASPGGGFRPPASLPAERPSLYLVAGRQEPFFAENAERWLAAFEEAGGDVVMHVREGDHGGDFWYEEFPLMVRWAFDRTHGGDGDG